MSSSSSLIRVSDFLKELDGSVYVRSPFIRSVVVTFVKLQMSHRNALHEVMH